MSQNPSVRRTYIIRPRRALLDLLALLGHSDFIESCKVPTVVMTEALPFEGKLEGYRTLILKKCKERFLAHELSFLPLSDTELHAKLVGVHSSLVEAFDTWWESEEAESLEIQTDW